MSNKICKYCNLEFALASNHQLYCCKEHQYKNQLKLGINKSRANGASVPFSEEHIKKIKEARIGYKHSEETKKKMSLSQSNRTPQHRKNISRALTGKHLPIVVRNKISQTLTGKIIGENHPNYGKGYKWSGEHNPMYGK